jgi:hypothetical protein
MAPKQVPHNGLKSIIESTKGTNAMFIVEYARKSAIIARGTILQGSYNLNSASKVKLNSLPKDEVYSVTDITNQVSIYSF